MQRLYALTLATFTGLFSVAPSIDVEQAKSDAAGALAYAALAQETKADGDSRNDHRGATATPAAESARPTPAAAPSHQVRLPAGRSTTRLVYVRTYANGDTTYHAYPAAAPPVQTPIYTGGNCDVRGHSRYSRGRFRPRS